MTLQQMLRFSGSVLGPALVAQAVFDLLRCVPEPAEIAAPATRDDGVNRLLLQAFPDGLDL